MNRDYSDIINMPHHVSCKHRQMARLDRAAQFAPFAALTGFDEDIDETTKEKLAGFDELGRIGTDVSAFEDPC